MIRIDEHGLTESSRSRMHGCFIAASATYFVSLVVGGLMIRESGSWWLGGTLIFTGAVIGSAYMLFGIKMRKRANCEFCVRGDADRHGIWPASGWSVACCHQCYQKHGVR